MTEPVTFFVGCPFGHEEPPEETFRRFPAVSRMSFRRTDQQHAVHGLVAALNEHVEEELATQARGARVEGRCILVGRRRGVAELLGRSAGGVEGSIQVLGVQGSFE